MKLKRLEEISPLSILIIIFTLSLFSFLIVDLFPVLFYRMIETESYLVFHNIAEFFSIIVSFSIFGVGWYTFDQSRDRHALFLSSAFLGIGLLDFMHTLSYAGMPAFITTNSANKSTQLWIVSRMFTAIVFLLSAFIESDSKSRWLTKFNLLAVILTVSGLVFFGIILYPLYMPATFIVDVGLTPFKTYSEYLIISLFIITSVVYWKRFLRTGNMRLIFYIAAFVFCIFSELAFAGYKSVFDTYNVLGHIYKMAAFVLIYCGIFITTVKHPYSVLQMEVTERKKAEDSMRESEERYRRLVMFSPFGIAIHSEGKLLYMNVAGAKILGTEKPDEIIGKNLLQIVHPDYHGIVKKRICMQENGGMAPPLEEKFLRLDGTSVDVEIASIPFTYIGKKSMYGVFREITERKKAGEMQRKLSSAVEHTADIVVITRKDGTIEYVNPAFEKITGYTMEEVVGKTPRILKSGKQDNKFYENLWGTILSGEVYYGELINKKNNGELYYTEKTITPVIDEHGIITHFVSTDKDITERKKAEEVYHENLRLEAADKAKSEFLANMSHELRTPLNASIGFSELLALGMAGELSEKQKHYVDIVLTSNQFLLTLINDILDLSKIESGKIDLVPSKMSVPETIKETLSLIKEKAMKHKVLLKTEFDPELEFIEADKQRFKQILFNLLSNAVKFSNEEGGTVTITAKKEGDMAQISVSDTGIGIKEENVGKLFHKFEQLESGISQKYGGTGLGLTITKQLVELHGGRIWVESRYGDGSKFIFTIPLKDIRGRNNK